MACTKNRKARKPAAKKPSPMELLNDDFIKSLEEGNCLPWAKNWQGNTVSPRLGINGSTGNPYKGFNTLLLMIAQASEGYKTSTWLTYKQAQTLGGQVTKAAKGKGVTLSRVVFKKVEEEDKNGETKEKQIPRLYAFTVFNVEHIEGLPEHLYADTQIPESERYDSARNLIEALGVTVVHGGDTACLIPSTGQINMPLISDFKTEEDYWATLFHEVGHWTGIKSNLSRINELDYAEEEAVAELFAVMMGAYFGISGDLRHEDYISTWLGRAKEGKDFLQKAISYADKAVQFAFDESGFSAKAFETEEAEDSEAAA